MNETGEAEFVLINGKGLVEREKVSGGINRSDFPYPSLLYPGSKKFITNEVSNLPNDVKHKVICSNARHLYGFNVDGDQGLQVAAD